MPERRVPRPSSEGALDPERIASYEREAALARRLASAIFHASPGIEEYRAIHLITHLISLHCVVEAARPLTRCRKPNRGPRVRKSNGEPWAAYRCHKCDGCRLDTALRTLDGGEQARVEHDAAVAQQFVEESACPKLPR